MNIQSGVFTTAQAGIYQISFSAKYVASKRGTYGAWSDIYVNSKVKIFAVTICYIDFIIDINVRNYI